MSPRRMGGMLLSLFAAAVLVTGCGKGDQAQNTGTDTTQVAEKQKDEHSEWWCVAHGIPEAECSMCDPKVAKAFKDKGDWCKEHRRAKSQCFICDPSLKETFAAKYRAKYGEDPPEEKDPKKEGKK